jgi:hypothetical protein
MPKTQISREQAARGPADARLDARDELGHSRQVEVLLPFALQDQDLHQLINDRVVVG